MQMLTSSQVRRLAVIFLSVGSHIVRELSTAHKVEDIRVHYLQESCKGQSHQLVFFAHCAALPDHLHVDCLARQQL
jgi:hypothetical protein